MDRMSFKVVVPLICFACTLYGLYSYLNGYEKNSCNMTYMFEYPEYIKIPLKNEVAKMFPRYNLYVYGEGRYAKELREFKITGIPVLFIPGNAGSYRQARSIASVALRMSHSRRTPFHFDVFAIDFREELSGLYGGVLKEQTAFTQECIRTIRSIYLTKARIIMIGHSMGGVIARAVFMNDLLEPESVSLIYTLAAPHKRPVIPFDTAFNVFFAKLANEWNNKTSELRKIPILSIGSGERDVVVRSELTSLRQPDNPNEYHVLAPAIPGVWVSTDHLAIVWCKQLVLAIVRSMFDVIETDTNEITENLEYIRDVLNFHFVQRSYDGHFPKVPFLPTQTFTTSGQWKEQVDTAWRFSKSKVFSNVYFLVPLKEEEHVIIVASGLVKFDWIFACNAYSKNGSKLCSEGTNLSKQGSLIPSKAKDIERRLVRVTSFDLLHDGFSHVVVCVAASNTQVDVLGERYKQGERTKHFALPSLFERLISFSPVRIMNFPLADHAVFYNLTFSGLSQIVESASLVLETRICRAGSVVGQGIIKVRTLWSSEEHYHHIKTSLGGNTVIPIRPHFLPPKGANRNVRLEIILDPECSYVLFATFPVANVLSQFIKFYGLHIPGYVVALYLCVLSGQMYALGGRGTCRPILHILGKFPSFLSLVVLPLVFYFMIWITGFGPKILPLPDDVFFGESSFLYLFILRSLLYIVSYGLVVSLSLLCEKSIAGVAKLWIWYRKKAILQATERSLSEMSERHFQMSVYNLILCAMLEAIAVGMAGSFALALGLLFHISKLFIMCVKCKAEEQRRGSTSFTSKWHFTLVYTILWMFATLFTIPAVITWFKHLPFTLRLATDPHTFPCITLFLATTVLWQLPAPCSCKMYYKTASHVIHTFAVLSSLYGIGSIFRLLFFISFAFIVISVHQVVSFFKGSETWKAD